MMNFATNQHSNFFPLLDVDQLCVGTTRDNLIKIFLFFDVIFYNSMGSIGTLCPIYVMFVAVFVNEMSFTCFTFNFLNMHFGKTGSQLFFTFPTYFSMFRFLLWGQILRDGFSHGNGETSDQDRVIADMGSKKIPSARAEISSSVTVSRCFLWNFLKDFP